MEKETTKKEIKKKKKKKKMKIGPNESSSAKIKPWDRRREPQTGIYFLRNDPLSV